MIWRIEDYKMIRERSCFMMSRVGESQVYVMGGFDGYESLREVERIDLSLESPKFEELKPMHSPVKNGVSFYNESD
jgi:hypothetical protein